jgi:hypothetical protein
LALEATAWQGVCSCCLGRELTPVTAIDAGRWSPGAHGSTTTLLVRVSDALLFRLNNVPRIPSVSVKTLWGAISKDDIEYFLGQLPGRTALGSVQMLYETLRYSPEPLTGAVLDLCDPHEAAPPSCLLAGGPDPLPVQEG